MTTLPVAQSTDFRPDPAELDIDRIEFQDGGPGTVNAVFNRTQFASGLISNTATIAGDAGIDFVSIHFTGGGSFSAAGFSFENWTEGVDRVQLLGTTGDQIIVGSSKSDTAEGRGGLDNIDTGDGDDKIAVGADGQSAGSTFNGGAHSFGGADLLVLTGASNSVDFRSITLIGLEELEFNDSNQSATFSGAQIAGFSRIRSPGVAPNASVTVVGQTVDMSGIGFVDWDAGDTITITAEGALPVLIGSSRNDIINGVGTSLDTMTGGLGADTLNGGNNNDKFRYVSNGDAVAGETINGGAGTDQIVLANVSGISFIDVTIIDVETLDYTTGNSTATFAGDSFDSGEIATVSGSLGVDRLIVTTDDQLTSLAGVTFGGWTDGIDTITILGSSLTDLLGGSAQADIIDGGAQADLMGGGAGNDTYIVDVSNDAVNEAAGNGTDLVQSSATFTLSASQEIENLTLTGSSAINGTGNGLANILTGNSAANTLSGNAGADTLNGGGGGDTMNGGANDDEYFVDNAGDIVQEAVGGGTDKVFATLTYALASGTEVERLLARDAAATTAINLVGNDFDQRITGNAGANSLDGRGGADILIGLGGGDRYQVDNANDVVQEATGGGADRVLTGLSFTLTAGAEIESFLSRDAAATTVMALTGNAFSQRITGNAGQNVIFGKAGTDTLVGLGGEDNFIFDTALGAGNIDTVQDFSHADDTIRLDDAIFTGLTANAYLTASQFHVGAAAADTLDRVIYNNLTGALIFDADGSGVGAAQQFAILTAGLSLANNDFFVI